MKKAAKKSYTIMFVPHDEAKPFSIRIQRNVLRLAAGFGALIIIAIAYVLVALGGISIRLQLVDKIKADNVALKAKNAQLLSALQRAAKTEILGAYLQRLALISSSDGDAETLRAQLEQLSRKKDLRLQTDAPAPGVAPPLPSGRIAPRKTTQALSAASIPNVSPVEGWVTRVFESSPEKGAHQGIDFAAAEGTPIRATAPGVVTTVENNHYFGWRVTLSHARGFVTRYGHCSQILVKQGARVERGQTIALVGNTGRSTAPHLHYEVHSDGVPVDPAGYIFTTAAD